MKTLFTHLSHLSSSATSQMLVTGLIALYMSLWFPANIPTLTFPIHLVWHIFEKAFFLGICEEFFKEQHSRTTGLETYVSSNHLCTPSPHSCLQKKKKKLLSLTDTYSTLFTTLCIHNIPFLGPLQLRGGALPTLQKSSVPWVSFSRCLPWSPVCSWTMDLSHCRELRIATEYLDTYSQIVKN